MTTDQLTLPDGLVGLPALMRFTIRVVEGAIVELQSLDDEAFGVLAIAGELVKPGLGAILVERALAEPGDEVLVLLSIHGDPPSVTANLAGPIVVAADGTARQVVVEDPDLSVRASVGSAAL